MQVVFDDEHAVANAGLVLPATLSARLDLEAVGNRLIRLSGPGRSRPGRKLLTVVHAMAAGGDCIDDVDVLRAGESARVLAHRVMAPSTIGTFLRSFTFGHVRQLDAWSEHALAAAWAAGAGPGDQPCTVDMDSTICETFGHAKQGASYSYLRRPGYHPLLATRADTGEVLHVRFRQGRANTGRGAPRFVDELAGRLARAGATGQVTLRADAGFWSKKITAACRRHGMLFSITVRRTTTTRAAIAAIPETAWETIDGYPDGIAQVAETVHGTERLIVRRVRNHQAQQQLFVDWRHHAFITNRPGRPVELDADHRRHAVVELAIRDLKDGPLAHCPSGRFNANAAWCVLATVAHNLMRWLHLLTGGTGPIVAATLRRRLLIVPGRITRGGRTQTLHLPARWPWADQFTQALQRLRALPMTA
jgi:hypothetical protein